MPYPTRIPPWRGGPNWNMVHGIRCRARFDGVSANGLTALAVGKSVPIGTLPPGAFILPVILNVITLLNGTTPALIVGSAGDDDGFLTAAQSAVGTAGYKPNLTGGALLALAPDANEVPVYAKVTGTGITAGEFDFLLPFYIHQN